MVFTTASYPAVGKPNPVDDAVAPAAIRYLKERAGKSQPWAMVASFCAPHPPWRVEQTYLDGYSFEDIDLPIVPEGHLENQHPVHRRLRAARHTHEGLYPDELVRRARMTYYALVTRIDERIGLILDALRESGQERDTLVVYSSDHGEMLGEQGLWNKSSMFEPSAHIPLIVRWTGHPFGWEARGECRIAYRPRRYHRITGGSHRFYDA